jgi:hypothetical protein
VSNRKKDGEFFYKKKKRDRKKNGEGEEGEGGVREREIFRK